MGAIPSPPSDSDNPAFIQHRKEGSSSQELGIFIANVDCVKSFSKLNSILATHTSENAIYVSLSNIGCRRRRRQRLGGGALRAKIDQKVKKPPLRVNDINFDFFFVFMYPYGSLGIPSVPKSRDALVESFRFTRYVERNKVHFAPFLRFH